ncbi:MAG: PQQ-like beta-propeller repeat protein [Planctomycetes bacterium]|nr:PQQ-like beta-propeller repeat protein [Planctomycetota bacterium]
MRTGLHALPLAVCIAAVSGSAFAENWPQWRGPLFNGSTTETGLPTAWNVETKQNVAWVAPMPGPAAATPAIWGDRVFISSVDKDTKDLVALCLDAKTGKELWRKAVGKDRKAPVGSNNMACPSPVTDGKTVWFYYGTGQLVAFDFDGKQLWARELEKDYGEFVVKYGYSSSPLLYKGRLYVLVMQNASAQKYGRTHDRRTEPLESFLLALDPASGKTLWKHVRETTATDESVETYLSPIPYESSGRAEIIIPGGECVTGHDAETGAELWRWWYQPADRQTWQRTVNSATPGDGLVYAVRPKHRSLYAIKGGGKGELGADGLAWRLDQNVPDVITPLLYQGRLYVANDGSRVFVCLDAKTGKKLWEANLASLPNLEMKGVLRASPTAADGKVYVISQNGEVAVLAAGDEFKVLSRTEMGEGPCTASIAIAGGKLFIRTAKSLYCISGAGKGRE